MPTINLLKKTKKKNNNHSETEMRKLRQKAYQNPAWRKMRNTFIKEHAICADCLNKGKVTASEDVHHIKSPFKDGIINWNLLLDYTNLVALCKSCHADRHNSDKGWKSPEQIIEELDALFGIENPNNNIEINDDEDEDS